MTPTIKFDEYDSHEDFGFVLIDYSISPAKLKTNYISVPGRPKPIDLSEYLGKTYDTREISISFYKSIDIYETNKFQSYLENIFNGRKMKVIFSNDLDYYFNARVNIDSIQKKGMSYINVKLKCIADPYKINIKDGTEAL